MHKKRLAELAASLKSADIQAAAILPSAALYYLTGMSLSCSERPLLFVVLDSGEFFAVCPFFEATRVAREAPYATIFTYSDEQGAGQGFAALAAKVGPLKNIAMEYQAARLLEYLLLKEHCGVESLADLRPLLAEQRMLKEPQEINKMQQAARLADLAMGFVEENLCPGISELSLLAKAEDFIKSKGGHLAFISIIGGERTALPHATTGARILMTGDVVVVDLGCQVEGYYSDITRTFLLGQASEKMLEVGKIVLAANTLAREAIFPGVSAGFIDQVAREYITKAGYGEFFTHRTGHGLGLEIHEEPYIVMGNRHLLAAGNTFTVEPGIYLDGIGGVRIEDDICVTATGAVSLTTYPRALKVVTKFAQPPSRGEAPCRP
ncbi:MAG: aminopeptidase P family protein [Peptococcaceae bacterium]|nr:aminopeptidase P family protein [Peptococcaceae bacterium]